MPSVRQTDRRRAAASHCRDEIYFRLTLSNLTGCGAGGVGRPTALVCKLDCFPALRPTCRPASCPWSKERREWRRAGTRSTRPRIVRTLDREAGCHALRRRGACRKALQGGTASGAAPRREDCAGDHVRTQVHLHALSRRAGVRSVPAAVDGWPAPGTDIARRERRRARARIPNGQCRVTSGCPSSWRRLPSSRPTHSARFASRHEAFHPPRACERTGERERHSENCLLAIGTSVLSPRNVKWM